LTSDDALNAEGLDILLVIGGHDRLCDEKRVLARRNLEEVVMVAKEMEDLADIGRSKGGITALIFL